MNLLLLAWEFFKTGLFAIGGGLATVPFLTNMAKIYPEWFTIETLSNMIAIGESTPGPIGVNMATYVGYTVAGVPGALIATFSLVLPSFLIILIISNFYIKYRNSRVIDTTFSTLRPIVTGLIAAAGFLVLKMAVITEGAAVGVTPFSAFFRWKNIALFLIVLGMTQIKKLSKIHPIIYILIGAGAGILFAL